MSDFRIHLKCPWCEKGETLADGRAKITISVLCGRCTRPYIADLDTMKTVRAKPQKRQGRKK